VDDGASSKLPKGEPTSSPTGTKQLIADDVGKSPTSQPSSSLSGGVGSSSPSPPSAPSTYQSNNDFRKGPLTAAPVTVNSNTKPPTSQAVQSEVSFILPSVILTRLVF
jgi:hypothetical protein